MEDSSVDTFVCQCKDEFRSACYGAAKYEYENKQYCVLHLPSQEKENDFKQAAQNKLMQNDFMFAGVYFPRDYDFSLVTFRKEADFSAAIFSEEMRFSTTFSKEANFSGATFSEDADFSGVSFRGEADFSGATFNEDADFSYGFTMVTATFSKRADFREATFKESALFNTLKAFPSTALVFSRATIEKPERISFHTAVLRPSWFVDVDAQKFDFSNVEWFRLPDASESYTDQLKPLTLGNEIENLVELENEIYIVSRRMLLTDQPEESTSWSQDARTRSLRKLTQVCRRLMKHAEESSDYPTANEFHYWSMEAQRKEGLSRLGVIATLYWLLSGYGERPLRAFGVLVGLWLTFATAYLLLADSAPFWVFSASDVWQGTDYARQAVVYSLSALARLDPEPKPEELGWFQTLVTVEGILGPLQIALFILAVRRKVMR